MKILIQEKDGPSIRLVFPTGLALNSLTASLTTKYLEQKGVPVTKAQAKGFLRALNRFRKSHRDWKLVEVLSADGDHIEIIL